jgi:hypothetical protein
LSSPEWIFLEENPLRACASVYAVSENVFARDCGILPRPEFVSHGFLSRLFAKGGRPDPPSPPKLVIMNNGDIPSMFKTPENSAWPVSAGLWR